MNSSKTCFNVTNFIINFNTCIKQKRIYFFCRKTIYLINLLQFLKKIGVVNSFFYESNHRIRVVLTYTNGVGIVHNITRISKGGKRVYTSFKNIDQSCKFQQLSVIGTAQGFLIDGHTDLVRVGGEKLIVIS